MAAVELLVRRLETCVSSLLILLEHHLSSRVLCKTLVRSMCNLKKIHSHILDFIGPKLPLYHLLGLNLARLFKSFYDVLCGRVIEV